VHSSWQWVPKGLVGDFRMPCIHVSKGAADVVAFGPSPFADVINALRQTF